MVRIALAATLLLFATGCSDSTTSPITELPLAVAVTADDVPSPGDGIFYYIGATAEDDPEPLLKEALRRGVALDAAWVPQYQTPCAAPGATEALVVRASNRTGPLADLGFVGDPEPWLVNCGIADFWKYDFHAGTGLQQVYFEVAHVNYAWGRVMKGYFVDGNGTVYSYDHSSTLWQPKDPDAVTGAELREKFANRKEVAQLNRMTLARMIALIDPAAQGGMSDPVSVCHDAGTYRYLAYQYEAGAYHPVLLYQYGDFAQRNLSDEAETLYTWLFTLSGGAPSNCLP